MCGIAGIYNLNHESVSRDLLLGMTRLLSHRGPDDEGAYISGNIGLGHRRLSIIDLSERGHQPMCNEDATIWIVFNGEIYNHLPLRRELEKKGHYYKSDTDTETILHLYEDKGIDCLQYLDGEFAFSIWDANKKIIFASRDRLGVKPFYYYLSDKHFIFASEIKAILLHPAVKKNMDLQALWYYFSFSVSPAPLTCFKDIFKLEAGHFLLLGQDGRLTKKEYWDAIPGQKISCTKTEAFEAIRQKLGESIQERLMSDVPFGVFLSGGIDSSTNVALMSRLITEPVKTFNVAIEGAHEYDESYFARLVSRKFKSQYHSAWIKFGDFYEIFDDAAYYCDEPLCDYACIPNFYLAKLAREKGVYVIQVGEGNDEIFCGYRSYAAIFDLIRFFSPLPRSVKIPILNLLKVLKGGALHYSIERVANNQEVFLGGSYLFTDKEKDYLFKDGRMDSSSAYVSGIYKKLLDRFPQANPLDKMIYLDLKVRLPELLLMRSDKMTMANSVEARLPFLDYQFVEYALSLPADLKYRNGITKYAFKKSLQGILPREVIYQPKKGFAGTPINIFEKSFHSYIKQLYRQTEPLLAQSFDLGCIWGILNFDRRKMDYRQGMKVWSVFTLMLWLRRFFLCSK